MVCSARCFERPYACQGFGGVSSSSGKPLGQPARGRAVAEHRRARRGDDLRDAGGDAGGQHVQRERRVGAQDHVLGRAERHRDRGEVDERVGPGIRDRAGRGIRIGEVHRDLRDVARARGRRRRRGRATRARARRRRGPRRGVRPRRPAPPVTRMRLIDAAIASAWRKRMPRSATRTGRPDSRERLPAIPTAMERTPSRQSAGRASGSSPGPTNRSESRSASPPPWPPSPFTIGTSYAASQCRCTSRRSPSGRSDRGRSGVDGARVEHRVQPLAGEHGAALDDLQLRAAFGAVDRDAIALPRRVGVEGVAERRARRVVDDEREVVLDRDALAEDVAVADVPVVLLGVEVQRLQALVVAKVEFEGIAPVVGAAGGTIPDAACRGVLGTVELQAARREDAARLAADPPVDEVEVVARLVDEEAPGVLLLAVPAAEVVRAVVGVQHPGEVDGGDPTDRAVLDHLAQRAVARRVAVVEGDDDLAAGAIDGVLDERRRSARRS